MVLWVEVGDFQVLQLLVFKDNRVTGSDKNCSLTARDLLLLLGINCSSSAFVVVGVGGHRLKLTLGV